MQFNAIVVLWKKIEHELMTCLYLNNRDHNGIKETSKLLWTVTLTEKWYARCKCCFFLLYASWSYLKCTQTIINKLEINRFTIPRRKILVTVIKVMKTQSFQSTTSTTLISHVPINWRSFFKRKQQVNDLIKAIRERAIASYTQK